MGTRFMVQNKTLNSHLSFFYSTGIGRAKNKKKKQKDKKKRNIKFMLKTREKFY